MTQKQNFMVPMGIMSFLFFLLGFMTWMNAVLIPFCETKFGVSNQEAQYINIAFFAMYIFSIPVSFLVKRIGYKPSVVLGSGILGLGALGFMAAVNISFYACLASLSCAAFGVVILQVVANPYVIALGAPEGSSSRLTFANAMNSLASVMAFVLGSFFLLKEDASGNLPEEQLASGLNIFLVLGVIAIVSAVAIHFMKLPNIDSGNEESSKSVSVLEAFKHPQLILGVVAIFFYMGVEMGVASFAVDYLSSEKIGMMKNFAGMIFGLYTLGFFLGRLGGAALLQKQNPHLVLAIACVVSIALIGLSLITSGYLSAGLIIAVGFFASIMWSVIFDLALKDIPASLAKQSSGIVCTAVAGCGLLTLIMSTLRKSFGIEGAYVAAIGFLAYITFYALVGSKMRAKGASKKNTKAETVSA